MPRAADRSLGDLAVSVSRAAKAVEDAPRGRPLRQSALFVTTEIRSAIRRDTGGDSRMSGVGRRGARVGARYKIRGTAAYISATGPLHLLERDTSPHTIPKKRRGGRKRYVAFSGKVYSKVSHPGTKGKHTFERAWKKAAPESVKVYGRETSKQVERAWRG